jgi:hypothetical protein
MTDYRTTEQDHLIELLSKYTAGYTKLLTENGSKQQLDELKKEIIAIQKEFNYRKKFGRYSDTSTDYISLTGSDIV